MSARGDSDQVWTEKDTAELSERLRTFRDRLPERQRIAFNNIVAGAGAAFRLGSIADVVDTEGESFAQALATFRDELPARQRDAFSSIITASAFAWGAAAQQGSFVPGNATGGEQGTPSGVIEMWHAFLMPLAIITVGVVLIVEEVDKDVDAQAPDLTGIPTTPEEPA